MLIPLLLFSTSLSAGFYKWMDDDGVVHYSDHPVEQAEEMHVPGTAIQKGREQAGKSETSGNADEDDPDREQQQASGYIQFEILDPEQNQTIRSGEGEVRVGMLLEPALQEGHRILLKVDGTPVQNNDISTHLILRDVPRGSHSIQASILDEEGQSLISTQTVHFHLRKAALKKSEP